MKKPAFIAALLLVPMLAQAQTVPGTITLRWTNPTTGCVAGSNPCVEVALTGPNALTAIEVYLSTAPIPDDSSMQPTLTLGGGATTTTHSLQVANGDTVYARVKARNAHGVSAFSAQVSKVIEVEAVPGVPTEVTLELAIGT